MPHELAPAEEVVDGVAAMERRAGAGARGGVVERRQMLAVSEARLFVVLGDVVEGLARVGVASEASLAEASRLRREGSGEDMPPRSAAAPAPRVDVGARMSVLRHIVPVERGAASNEGLPERASRRRR